MPTALGSRNAISARVMGDLPTPQGPAFAHLASSSAIHNLASVELVPRFARIKAYCECEALAMSMALRANEEGLRKGDSDAGFTVQIPPFDERRRKADMAGRRFRLRSRSGMGAAARRATRIPAAPDRGSIVRGRSDRFEASDEAVGGPPRILLSKAIRGFPAPCREIGFSESACEHAIAAPP